MHSLRVTKGLVPLVAPALQGLTGNRTTEVLPSLCNLRLEGLEPSSSLWEAIQPFVTARRLSDHAMAIDIYHRLGGRGYGYRALRAVLMTNPFDEQLI